MLAKNLAFALSALLVTACGANSAMQGQEQQDERSDDSTSQSSDATGTTKKKPAAKAESRSASEDQDLDCSGIPLHGDHESCDAQDVAVADGKDLPEAGDDTTTDDGDAKPTEPVEETPAADTGANKPEEPATKPAEPAKDPNIVEFRIKAGTGKAPLNTADTFVSAKVGQTLRFFNDDTITHRFHTGGVPCPHGENFAPGKSYDCKITQTIDTVAKPGALYEHISGPTALFYLKVTK